MSQYNPKFFSRDHISSISEALNQVLNGGTNSTHLTEAPETPTTSGRESGFGKGKTLIQPDNTWDEVARKDSGVASWAKRNNLDPATVDLKRENGKIYANGVEMTSASTKTSHYATGSKTRSEMNQKPAAAPAAAPKAAPKAAPAAPAKQEPTSSKAGGPFDWIRNGKEAPAATKRSSSGPTPQSVRPGEGGVPATAVPYDKDKNPQGTPGMVAGRESRPGPKAATDDTQRDTNYMDTVRKERQAKIAGMLTLDKLSVDDSGLSSPARPGVKKDAPASEAGVEDPNFDRTYGMKMRPDSVTKPQNKGVERVQESLVEAIRNLIRRNYR